MSWQTPEQYNVTNFETLLGYTSTVVPIFAPLVLFGFFIIILLGGYFSSKRLGDRPDFAASFAVAAYATAIAAMIGSLIENFISTYVLIFTIVISLIATIIFLSTRTE